MSITLIGLSIIEQMRQIAPQIAQLPEDEAIEVLNQIAEIFHTVHPLKEHPVTNVQWKRRETIKPNNYNPNEVPPPEMDLLTYSLAENGFAMPLVVVSQKEVEENEQTVSEPGIEDTIVDGEHRYEASGRKEVAPSLKGYLPITYVKAGRGEKTARMAATLQFNVHGESTIDGLSQMVLELTKRNWSPERIAKEYGMEPDKVVRLRVTTGLAEFFLNDEFSPAVEYKRVQDIVDLDQRPHG